MKHPFSERVRFYLEHGHFFGEPITRQGMMMVLGRRLLADLERARLEFYAPPRHAMTETHFRLR
jgi:hypothetical protein